MAVSLKYLAYLPDTFQIQRYLAAYTKMENIPLAGRPQAWALKSVGGIPFGAILTPLCNLHFVIIVP